MRTLFHTNTLNYRGTTVAVRDYARYNQEILGHESVIAYCKTNGIEKDMGNEYAVIEALEKEFQVVGYRTGDLEKKVDQLKIDTTYMISSGQKQTIDVPTNCNTVIHAVFQFNDPYGDRYAYISEWLSQHMTNGKYPFVPHMVDLPKPTRNYREHLGIKPEQKVIGRIGGFFTFDIPFVKTLVHQLANSTDELVFLFVGTEPFIEHPNVKFVNEIHDPQKKTNFIETCDAMLHARQRGESFGLSIAEFLSLNKPVFAWNNGHDKNHLIMLKDSGTLYNNEVELKDMLLNVSRAIQQEDWSKRVEDYKPGKVMKKFKEVFYDDISL